MKELLMEEGMATKAEMKEEAILRMDEMQLSELVIRNFEKHDKLYCSEGIGILYELDEETSELISKFEKEILAVDGIAYHVIRNYTEMGVLFTILYVSSCKEDWKYDREDLTRGIQIACATDGDMIWDFGSVQIVPMNGGICRIG